MRIVQFTELLRLNSKSGEVCPKVNLLGLFVDQAYGLSLHFGWLEVCAILESGLFMLHITEDFVFEASEVRFFDSKGMLVQ